MFPSLASRWRRDAHYAPPTNADTSSPMFMVRREPFSSSVSSTHPGPFSLIHQLIDHTIPTAAICTLHLALWLISHTKKPKSWRRVIADSVCRWLLPISTLSGRSPFAESVHGMGKDEQPTGIQIPSPSVSCGTSFLPLPLCNLSPPLRLRLYLHLRSLTPTLRTPLYPPVTWMVTGHLNSIRTINV